MSDAFDQAVAFVLRHEGQWSREASDAGGITRWGISTRAHPNVNLDTLTREGAIETYRLDYWLPPNCDAWPPPLALALFDGCIQHGVRTAVKLMQQSLGVTADGVVGPLTLEAARREPWGETLVSYLARRSKLYATLPAQAVFGYGWARRLFDVQRVIYEGGA